MQAAAAKVNMKLLANAEVERTFNDIPVLLAYDGVATIQNIAWTQRLKGLHGSIQTLAPTLYLANRCVGKMPPLCIKLLVQTFKPGLSLRQARPSGRQAAGMTFAGMHRSEERRVGKEGVSKCRTRGWP